MRASLYIALLTMAFVSTLPAAVVGTSTPALSLTAERMAALPEAQRNAWKEYLERSARQMQADRGFLRAELQAAGLKESRLDLAGLCTRCEARQFFSYRRERVSGRQGTVAALKI